MTAGEKSGACCNFHKKQSESDKGHVSAASVQAVRPNRILEFSDEFVRSRTFDLGGGDLFDFDETEEGREANVRKRVVQPTQEERMRHRATHIPYRSWCADCVSACGKDHPHKSRQEAEDARGVHEIHVDYCFLRDGEGLAKQTVLVVKSRQSRAVFAHVVPMKGVGSTDWAVEQLRRDIIKLGQFGKII